MKKIVIFASIIALLCGSVFTSKYYDTKINDLYLEVDEAFYNGFSDGKDEGYSEGYETGFDEGYQEGETYWYEKGYSEGFEDGETEVLDTLSEANETYDDGYEDGLEIGYASGYEDGFSDGKKSSAKSGQKTVDPEPEVSSVKYVLNKNTKKFHLPGCSSVNDIKASNRWDFSGTREEVISKGYIPCKRCYP